MPEFLLTRFIFIIGHMALKEMRLRAAADSRRFVSKKREVKSITIVQYCYWQSWSHNSKTVFEVVPAI
uniref:Uncharacterized protein n=1 Tax=Glossina palpalis gambiensis TaxID=67801 RepID=A0A1B0C4K2_9MUSC